VHAGWLGRLSDLARRFEAFVVATGILVMAAVTVANVVSRVVLGFSLSFAEEVAQCCVIAFIAILLFATLVLIAVPPITLVLPRHAFG